MNYDENGLVYGNVDGITVPVKKWNFNDVFPKTDTEHDDRYGQMMPDTVKKFYNEILTQRKLAEAAALIMDTMKTMGLTDDQRRSQKLKERMMKRKLQNTIVK